MLKHTLLISALLFVTTLAHANYRIHPTSKHIIDQYNRTVIYHGVNAVYKLPPSYPPILDKFDHIHSLAPIDFQNLRSWGLNLIRLYVAWEATEPIRNQYNYTYLEAVRNITRMAAQYNVTVLLDAHQDVLNRKLCGEGFPDWAVNRTDFPKPLDVTINYDENGHAVTSDCTKIDFRKYFKAHDVQKAWKAFYDDQDGIQESFAEFWKIVAGYFKEEPNVLGYDLINEPNTFDDSLVKNYDKLYLQPLYRRIHNKIRQVDDRSIIFFEPIWTDKISVGFTEGPGGPEYNDRQALSYHVYCSLVDSSGEPISPAVCQTENTNTARIKTQAAKKLGVGALLSEFGAVGNGTKGVGEIDSIAGIADTYLHSWAYWQFKYYEDFTTLAKPGSLESFYNEDGSLQVGKVKAMARTYVYATCGEPLSQAFFPATGRYMFVFKASRKCEGKKTEIFASEEFYYPNGVEYEFVNCDDCKLVKQSEKSYYTVEIAEDVEEDTRVTLQIVPIDQGTKQERMELEVI